MTVPFEAFNVIAPYRNSTGLASQACLVVSGVAQAFNLSDYFGALGEGHYFTIQADGVKMYVAIGANSGGQAIDETAQGSGPRVCFPIADGQQLPMRISGGRELGTGYATMVQYNSGIILHAKCATSAGTGFLRIYRSSISENQGLEQLRPPGFSGGG
jgi:hypothetical protein